MTASRACVAGLYRRANRAATELQRSCTRAATYGMRRRVGAPTELQQSCNRAAPELQPTACEAA
jgi:hypothetical protein